jgi:predicted DNA-binding transcriptional regulator AlpA
MNDDTKTSAEGALLSAIQVAELYPTIWRSRQAVYWSVANQELPVIQLGKRKMRFERKAIESWINSKKTINSAVSTGYKTRFI